MHLFYDEGIFYFVDRYGLAVEDFFSLFELQGTYKSASSAIRSHLLMTAGVF